MRDAQTEPAEAESLQGRWLIDKLGESDRVAIVVYAGASGTVLRPTRGDQKERILGALEELKAGGSTNGAQGIELAYKLAAENFIKGGYRAGFIELVRKARSLAAR